MKQLYGRLGLLATFLLCALSAAAYDFQEDGLCYNILSADDRTVSVAQYDYYKNADYVSGAVSVPAHVTHNGVRYTVTKIGDEAFRGCYRMVSVTLPETVVALGVRAFGACGGLNMIEIPNSVKTLGDGCFYNCDMLQYVQLGQSIETIEGSAFSGCTNLAYIEIPQGVTTIGRTAFYECKSLESIVLPNSVKEIGEHAFSSCYALKSVKLPEGLTSIEAMLFLGCGALEDIKIPETVESIGETAFTSCYALKEIKLPAGLKTIGLRAFDQCRALQSIAIPAGVSEIKTQTFYDCRELAEVTFDDIDNSRCETIGDLAFAECMKLKSIRMPNSVTTIGKQAFRRCTSLEEVVLPDQLVTLRSYTFEGCPVSSIQLPETLAYIEDGALTSAKFTSIVLPKSLLQVGSCFNDQTLKLIFCKAVNPPSGQDNTFSSNILSNALLCVPVGSEKKYKMLKPWSGFAHIEEDDFEDAQITPGVFDADNGEYLITSIADRQVTLLQYEADDMAKVDVPSTVECNSREYEVTAIDKQAFMNAPELAEVVLPESILNVATQAFYNCSNLYSVTICGGNTNLQRSAFSSAVPKEVRCLSSTPPEGDEEAFNSRVYTDATLYIPQGALEAYSAVSPWSKFAKVSDTLNPAGIANVTTDALEEAGSVEYYNLQGIRVNAPAPGEVYIRREGAKADKVIY